MALNLGSRDSSVMAQCLDCVVRSGSTVPYLFCHLHNHRSGRLRLATVVEWAPGQSR